MAGKPLLIEILLGELERRPGASPRDLRKLIMQSVLGGDHLRADADRFRSALRAEWNGLSGHDSPERAIQLIDPIGQTARVHLLPCFHAGVALEDVAALLLNQPWKQGSSEEDLRRWDEAVALAAAGRLPFSAEEMAEWRTPQGPMHHSSSYGFTSYRILNDVGDPTVSAWLLHHGMRPS